MAEPAPAEEDAPKHPRKTYKPHGNDLRFQVDMPPKKQAGLQDDILGQAFKKCCKTWMQREDTEVGQLATPWTVRGKDGKEWRSRCICIEHEECRQRRGRAFQIHGQMTRSADGASVAVKLSILSCGDCGTTPRKLRADSCAEDPATFTGRKRVREAVQALAADDETVTPVRVARA